MKICRIRTSETGNQVSYARLEEDHITLLQGSIFEQIRPASSPMGIEKISAFLPPVDPPNLIAVGLNYRKHAAESNSPLPSQPLVFLKATSALTGHNMAIQLPGVAPDEVDFEAELCAVIRKTTSRISAPQAFDHILGYTCANDVSARDCQHRIDRQWARAKSFDTFAPVGPWIETDLDPSNLRIRSILNGEIMQEAFTSDMIFSVPELVSYLSHSMTLLPGTLILTGTPHGVGCARKPPRFLRKNDRIEIDIEGIGRLTNTVR